MGSRVCKISPWLSTRSGDPTGISTQSNATSPMAHHHPCSLRVGRTATPRASSTKIFGTHSAHLSAGGCSHNTSPVHG